MAALAETLSTPAWAGLTDPSSPLGEFLLSDAFKNGKKGLSYDQIDVDYLILFGMLHCRDKSRPERKAVGFYEVLQDGGLQNHQHISAGDKDLEPTFQKLCEFATIDVFEAAKLKTVNYSEADKNKLTESAESVLEEWLDFMYGNKSTLSNDVWMEKILSREA